MHEDCKSFPESSFYKEWAKLSLNDSSLSTDFIESSLNEMNVMRNVLSHLPQEELVLNISNSMAIRWASYSSELISANWKVFEIGE
ncbi:MAG: hypothetical protein R2852_01830 [Bacteroidia bacterium]